MDRILKIKLNKHRNYIMRNISQHSTFINTKHRVEKLNMNLIGTTLRVFDKYLIR